MKKIEKIMEDHKNSKALKLGCWACFVDLKHSHTYTYCNPNAQKKLAALRVKNQTLNFSKKIGN